MQLSFKPQVKYGFFWLLIYLGAFAYALSQDGISLWLLASYFVHFFIFSFGVSFGLHRSLVHGQRDSELLIVKFASLIGLFANSGSPVTWLVTHSHHHKFSDTELDPQSASQIGPLLIIGALRETDISKLGPTFFKTVFKKVSTSWYYLFLHKYYYLVLLGFFLTLFCLGGRIGLLYFGLIPSGMSFLSLGFLNYFCHLGFGYQNHKTNNSSKNCVWLFFLLFGENWHNNHHFAPNSETLRERWWEVDLIYPYFFLTRMKVRPSK